MPRAGGPADKLGNRYELAWAIRHALTCIKDEECSITLEEIDPELANGAEFTFRKGDRVRVDQVKRQHGGSNSWTVAALEAKGVFGHARNHVAAGREYHFSSLVPCEPLRELAERARESADLETFEQHLLTAALRPAFDHLANSGVFSSRSEAWVTLRGMRFQVREEDDVVRTNAQLAELTLEGAGGHLMALAIGDILLDNLAVRLGRRELLERLSGHGIRPLHGGIRTTTHERVQAVTESWRSSVSARLLRPVIPRREAQMIADPGDSKLTLVVGAAGGGKSAALEQAVTALLGGDAEVLAFRLDGLNQVASTSDLGSKFGFDRSPVSALAVAADGGPAYLVLDQLDAVSLISGRIPTNFDVIADLVREASALDRVHVVLACRRFDMDNDDRIKGLASGSDRRVLEVGDLSAEAVGHAVSEMGLDLSHFSVRQQEILRSPMHLVLLSAVADQNDALGFETTSALFDIYWERKRRDVDRRRPGTRFQPVVARVAREISDRQTLSVPWPVLDDDDLSRDADILVSEHVLVRDGQQVAFFHETFFDYAFARQWSGGNESLVDFLTHSEQELFRRAQVRQILQHLRERDPDRFIDELEGLLTSPRIRFHIKDAATAVLGALRSPTAAEVELVQRVVTSGSFPSDRVWWAVSGRPWFNALSDAGLISDWLGDADPEVNERALRAMYAGAQVNGDLVADILEGRRETPEYSAWVRRVVGIEADRGGRSLFDLVLDVVRSGGYDAAEHEFWMLCSQMVERQPGWALELLDAKLMSNDSALALDGEGKVAALIGRDHSAAQTVRKIAEVEPLAFCEAAVPYLLTVVSATAMETSEAGLIQDRHFWLRFPSDDPYDLDDAILEATASALASLVDSAISGVGSLLQSLAADPHQTSQYLLYRALAAGRATYATWAAELLLEGGARLKCGYASDADWTTRELLAAIAPHVSADLHQRLEDVVRDLRTRSEEKTSVGYRAFKLLSALDEGRLTTLGTRRLAEYRRKFRADKPAPPLGVTVGIVPSPIPENATAKMTNEQWLQAMARYNTEHAKPDFLAGGARELAQVLRGRVAEEPVRFAELATQLPTDLHPSYDVAFLMGLGDTATAENDEAGVFDAIRHLSSFGGSDHDRWLGWALRRHLRRAPVELVALVLNRALHSADPVDDSPVITSEGSTRAEQLHMNGMNVARGALAESLGDLLIHDPDGARIELVRGHLADLAQDPVQSVRVCVAHTLAGALQGARTEAVAAFELLTNGDDILLATRLVQRLILRIGDADPSVIDPVLERMLGSDDGEVREAGGTIAAYAALAWEKADHLVRVHAADAETRVGAAKMCAGWIGNAAADEALGTLFNDPDDAVRKAAARAVIRLRGKPLRPHARLLMQLIESPALTSDMAQLQITLQEAPDRVDDLMLRSAQRFLDLHGAGADAAADAHYVSEQVVRGLAQARDRHRRAELLDVVDRLVELGVYGVNDAISQIERG
ncbi:MAG: hypothetical protein ACRDTJ_09200 [Pseudonocardiaceae bacterium]